MSYLPCQGRSRQSPIHAGTNQHQRRPHPVHNTTSSALPNRPIAPINTAAMADQAPKPSVTIPRTTRPMSEALLNEKVRRAASRAVDVAATNIRSHSRALCSIWELCTASGSVMRPLERTPSTPLRQRTATPQHIANAYLYSGIAAYPPCSSAPASASASASSSPCSSSSDAHGPHSLVSDSALDGRGKSAITSVPLPILSSPFNL